MNSSPQAFGSNPLVATDVNALNDQKRSIVNPGLSDKSLNTKEFSDVMDEQSASEKVASTAKTDSAATDALDVDKAPSDLSGLLAAAESDAELALSGNDLPLPDAGLPAADPTTFSEMPLELGPVETNEEGVVSSFLSSKEGVSLQLDTDGRTLAVPSLGESGETAKGIGSNSVQDSLHLSSTLPKEVQPLASKPLTGDRDAHLINRPLAKDSAEGDQSFRQDTKASQALLDDGGVDRATKESKVTDALVLSRPNAGSPQRNQSSDLSNGAPSIASLGNSLSSMTNPPLSAAAPAVISEADLLAQVIQTSTNSPSPLTLGRAEEALETKPLTKTDFAQVYKAAAAASTSTAPAVDTTKPGWNDAIMQRVMWMSSQQINRAEIQLDPPELGALQVRISTTQSEQTSVVFTSQSSAVREVLDQGLHRLREMMESQGINLADVNVSDQSAQQQRQEASAESDGGHLASKGEAEEIERQGIEDEMAVSHSLNLVDHYV